MELAGGLKLRADGAELALPASKRARAVLAYLALNAGPQPRGQLAARFWPDVLDESARARLADAAARHLEDAIRLNDALGCVVWRAHAERQLARIAR